MINKTTKPPCTAISPESSCSHMMQTLWHLETRSGTSNVIQTPRTQAEMLLVSIFTTGLCFWQQVPTAPSTLCSLVPTHLHHRQNQSLSPAEFNPVPYVPLFVLSFPFEQYQVQEQTNKQTNKAHNLYKDVTTEVLHLKPVGGRHENSSLLKQIFF